jgi:exodeoxyribonuclease VII small subunit
VSAKKQESIGYAAAVEELESILAVLERDDLDIDVLGPQVQRAALLIRICRDRIATARDDVEQIIADLGSLSPAASETGSTAEPDSEDEGRDDPGDD